MKFEKINRFEYKYYISYIDYEVLKSRLSGILDQDKNAGLGGKYKVSSLYFDNLNNQSYYDKIEGLLKRQKLRIRLYNDNFDIIKLELKEKLNDVVRKTSSFVSLEQAKEFLSNTNDISILSKNHELPENLSYFLKSDFYRPVVTVMYNREAFVNDFNNIRITFDTCLRKKEYNSDFFSSNAGFYPVDNDNLVILEVKYNNFLPNYISRLLTFNNSNRLAISKYCLSREFIY